MQTRIEQKHVSKASRVNMCTDLEVPFVNDKLKRTHNSAIVGFGFSYILCIVRCMEKIMGKEMFVVHTSFKC